MTADTPNRRYEFDWLRVLGTLTVFLFHSPQFFKLSDWLIKNVNTYVWVEIWVTFTATWLMPLFFIISGASLFYAIEKSGGFSRFYTDKFLRLMIPVLTASVTLSALQVYLERLTHGHFSGSFFSFILEYFNGIYMGIGSSGNFAYHGMHLWYILELFLFSLICYHPFIWLKGSGRKILNRITALFDVPGLIYIWFSIPLLIMKALMPKDILTAGAGAWGILYYLWFLIAGFMIVSSERLQQNIRNQRWISLLLGIVLSAAYLYQLFSPSRAALPTWTGHWVNTSIYFFSAWCWLFAILGFGMRFLAFDRPLLRYANEGVLPFYILHLPVMLGIGYFVMTWEIHDFLKWTIVFTSSFIVIIMLYVFLVRKFELFRFLFGMKTTRPFFSAFRKTGALIILHILYVGVIVFAVSGASVDRSPMPIMYDPEKDIILDVTSITDMSSTGVSVVNDNQASIGQAVEFSSGANKWAEPHPQVYVEMRFSAPAGTYTVWLRGKSDKNSSKTDSVWLQTDDKIGTRIGSFRMGNWLDIHPTGVYAWAGDGSNPVTIELKHTGDHAIRIQPRQTPHRIDQIWLSRAQNRIPDTFKHIANGHFIIK